MSPEKPTTPKEESAQKVTTPKVTPKKRPAETSSLPQSQDVRFAWACFKSTGQNVDYELLGHLFGCSKEAARKRYYKFRDVFQDMDSVLANDASKVKKSRKVENNPEQSTPRSTLSKKASCNMKAGVKRESPELKKEALEALESLEDLPSDVESKLEDFYDEA